MVNKFNQAPATGTSPAETSHFEKIFPYYNPEGDDIVIGRQTDDRDWMTRQVEILRSERLGTPDTNQQQGEQ